MFKGTLVGNLGADAEVRNENGQQFVSFKVADSRKWRDQSGAEHEETTWVSCTINGNGGELLQYLRKGVKILAIGRLSFNVYSSRIDRCMKAGVKMFVESIELIGGSSEAVPRELITENGEILPTFKAYYIDPAVQKTAQYKLLYDKRGASYVVDSVGYILPNKESTEEQQPQ